MEFIIILETSIHKFMHLSHLFKLHFALYHHSNLPSLLPLP